MMVRRNCLTALREVREYENRKPHRKKPLWLDSVSINQEDLHEKSFQVQMMGDIYHRAKRVLISLGPHADNSVFFIKYASTLLPWMKKMLGMLASEIVEGPTGKHNQDYFEAFESWVDKIRASQLARLFQAFVPFSRRQYWSRDWILQEVYQARRALILCGDLEIYCHSLHAFLRVLINVQFTRELVSLHPHINDTIFQLPMWDVISLAEEQDLSLAAFLRNMDERSCSDVRDRVYSIVGIVPCHSELGPIVPDYTKTRGEVLLQAAQQWAQFLSHIGHV
jgi:hypothetical protein